MDHKGTKSVRISSAHPNESAKPRSVAAHVYLVGRVGCEGMSVDYICSRKETAKEKFDIILARLTEDAESMYRENSWDDRKHLNYLEAQTFEKQRPEGLSTVLERPYWEKREVIE